VPRFVDIQPGGEKYLAFALSKLRLLKAWMKPVDLRVMSKHFWVNPTDKIWIKALDLGNDIWWDWIRIEAGGNPWRFYVTIGTDLYFGVLSAPVVELLATPLTASRVISTLEKVRALSRDTVPDPDQWKIVDDQRKVSRLHDGAFDSYASVLAAVTANPKSLGFVLSGSDIRFMDESSIPDPNALEQTIPNSMVVPARGGVFSQAVFPLESSFVYGRWEWDFGGSGKVTEFFDLATRAVTLGGLSHTDVDPKPLSTYHDVVFMEYALNLDTASFWSARNGLLGSWSRVGGEFHPDVEGGRTTVSSRRNYYSFEIENEPGDDTLTFGVNKAIGLLDVEGGLSYLLGRSTPTVTGLSGLAFVAPAVATQSKAYAAFLQTANLLKIVDDAGVITTLDTAHPGVGGFLSTATKDHAWWPVRIESGGATTIRFFNELGLAHESASIAGVGSTNFAVTGTTRDHVFVRAVFGGVEYIIGSDGTRFKFGDALPAWVTSVSVGDHLTDAAKLYALRRGSGNDPDDDPDLGTVQTLHHVTSNAGASPAPVVFRYSLPASSAPIVTIPIRSAIQGIQERETW